MKQVFQDLNSGIQRIDNVPTPNINNNQVDIIRNIKTYTTNSELLSILNEGT